MRSKKRGIYFSFIYTSSRIRDCHERVYVILSLTLNGIDWMQMCKVLFVVIVVVVCSCLTHNRKKISKRKKTIQEGRFQQLLNIVIINFFIGNNFEVFQRYIIVKKMVK